MTERRPCVFLALPHVPLDGVDDAQEPKTYRPEMILAVDDLAKRFAPVHKGIVVAGATSIASAPKRDRRWLAWAEKSVLWVKTKLDARVFGLVVSLSGDPFLREELGPPTGGDGA